MPAEQHRRQYGWGQLATDYGIRSAGAVATVIHTFRPNLINEFTAGINPATIARR